MDRSDIVDRMYQKALTYCPVNAFINGVKGTGLVRELKDGYKNGVDYKLFVTQMSLKQGDIIEINNIKYIVRTLEVGSTNKASICKAQSIIWGTYNQSLTNTTDTYALVEGYLAQQVDGSFNTTLTDKIVFIIPEEKNSSIEVNKHIQFKNDIYKIISIDKSVDDIYIITAEYYTKGSKPSISITPKSIELTLGDTQQLTVEVTLDGIKIENPLINYSYDNAIISISDTGLVTALKEGNTTIVATYEGVSNDVSVLVKAKDIVVDKYTILGVPSENMVINTTDTFTLDPKVGVVTWRFNEEYEVGVAEIVSTGDYTCDVKCLKADNVFELIATVDGKDVATRVIFTSKR